jgi:hypothetical protein
LEDLVKKAKDKNEAWNIQDTKDNEPHGWIQWKGTDVCMDIHCKCGESTHVDGYFAHHVKCGSCGTVYFCNGHIELIELEQEPDNLVVKSV